METKLTLHTNPVQALEKLMEYVAEIPFENSDFQNQHSVINMEMSPHRAYRHAAIRIKSKIMALNECHFDLRKKAIEIKKLERSLSTETDELERELLQIRIEEIRSVLPYIKKLTNDAIAEIRSLEPIVLSMGKLSRAEFEAAEKEHFEKRSQLSEGERYLAAFDNDLYGQIVAKAIMPAEENCPPLIVRTEV